MKRICITYHMNKPGEADENCITTTLSDELADALLAGRVPCKVEFWLDDLAEMQGYHSASFISAIPAEGRDSA